MEQRVKYVPLVLLLANGVKSLVVGLSWETVAISSVMAGLWYLLEYKSTDKKLQALSKEIEDLKVGQKNTEIVLTDFRTSISSLRMTNGLNPAKFGGR